MPGFEALFARAGTMDERFEDEAYARSCLLESRPVPLAPTPSDARAASPVSLVSASSGAAAVAAESEAASLPHRQISAGSKAAAEMLDDGPSDSATTVFGKAKQLRSKQRSSSVGQAGQKPTI